MNQYLCTALILVPVFAYASTTPLSGTFSNAGKDYKEHMSPSINQKINLIVTVNKNGQQFFIQCFEGEDAGFGVVTELKQPQTEAVIQAGPECPSRALRVELDYEEAFIRSSDGWAHLMRSNVYVPIKD